MITKIKNIICVILAIAVVASLAGCATVESIPASIDKDGVFTYAVTRAFDAVQEAEDGAKNIRIIMKENFDCKITIIKDVAVKDFDGNYEVLVGDTNREESAAAKQKLIDARPNNSADFIVAVMGDKIVIQAVNSKMLPVACEWFIKNFCGSIKDWEKLYQGYEFIYQPESAALNNYISGKNFVDFTFVLPRKHSMLHGLVVDEIRDYYTNHDYLTYEAEDLDAETEYEILIGDCDRPASKAVTVEGDNYVIKVVGTKLIVKGGSDLATWRALKKLFEEVVASEGKENGFNWADGYVYNGKYDANEAGTYTLNWYDEFDGSTIDLTKWSDYRKGATEVQASCLGGSMYQVNVRGESAYTGSEKKNLIHQTDGELVCGTVRVNENDFVTSQISTYWTMTWKYGVMDIYSKLAPDPAYTTYWANGAGVDAKDFMNRFGGNAQDRVCMTEIDILENYSRPYEYGSTVHWWWTAHNADGTTGSSSGHKGLGGNTIFQRGTENSAYLVYNQQKYGDFLYNDYHMYSFSWDDKCIKFAFDGKVFMDYQYSQFESVSVHCLMNYFISSCAMGSPSYGYTYKKGVAEDYYEHRIDYIRLYQTDAINSQMITAWPEHIENGTYTIRYPQNTIGGRY